MRSAISILAGALVAVSAFRPELADRSMHLLITVVATVLVVSVAHSHVRQLQSSAPGPFVPPSPPESPTIATSDVTELVTAVEGARRDLPPVVRSRLREAAAGRLADHHGLSLEDEHDSAAIRDMVSAPMWAVLTDSRPTSSTVRLSSLSQLLDELENL